MRIKRQLKLSIFTVAFSLLIAVALFLAVFFLWHGRCFPGIWGLWTFLVFSLIGFFCLFLIIHIYRTISKSISFLQKSTKRLADGELYESLERRKNSRGENEITDLIVNLEKMRLSLQNEVKRKERFIMGLSHDLRTPVAVIKGYAEALKDGIFSTRDEVDKTVDTILAKSNQLENMINTLINFVKMENSDWAGSKALQNLYPVLNEFLSSSINSGAVFKRNVSGIIEIDRNEKIYFDKDLLLRALENLFSNAMRYTSEGDSICIKAFENENEIFIAVSDSGIGIDEKDIQYIFDFLYRSSSSRREAGYGIGLAVVKNIIDSHGWTITVKSKIGVGTEFTIKIPKNDSKA